MMQKRTLSGPRFEIGIEDAAYPDVLRHGHRPPKKLYGIGDASALREGLAVVGARRATPYGIGCAKRFAYQAAERGVIIISGGARGCDAVAHEAALAAGAPTVVVLGGGCDDVYPIENIGLFQRVIDAGGAVISEQEWAYHPLPRCFRERNRIIAGLARATLIVEAGLPSGTFSTADEAIAAGRDVLVVPGAITSKQSRGANRLLYQGAVPIVDDESFADQMAVLFGCLEQEEYREPPDADGGDENQDSTAGGKAADGNDTADSNAERFLLDAVRAEPLDLEALKTLAQQQYPEGDPLTWLMVWLAKAQRRGWIGQYPDGRYGPLVA